MKKILYIDDSYSDLYFMKKTLDKFDIDIIHEYDDRDLADYDLIIIDINLQKGVNGMDIFLENHEKTDAFFILTSGLLFMSLTENQYDNMTMVDKSQLLDYVHTWVYDGK